LLCRASQLWAGGRYSKNLGDKEHRDKGGKESKGGGKRKEGEERVERRKREKGLDRTQ
jgi:hypothetical protein